MHSLFLEDPIPAQTLYSQEDLAQLDLNRIPRHLAIIMDGNRRWAKKRGLPPMMGHWKGADTLTLIVRAAAELGVKAITVYAFSTENWGRPQEEVQALMHLFQVYLEKQRLSMVQEGVRLETIGNIEGLPEELQEVLARTKEATAHCQKIDLVLAINYGGRDDIRRAFLALMRDCEHGKVAKSEISEQLIARYLDTAHWPDPEILIRTSGEKRQSNFLIWQLSYSEFYYREVFWPDFDEKELLLAIEAYQHRARRFGGA